jgi:3-hydroxybutyryl-CoA dehydratase
MERPRACKTIEELRVGERIEKKYSISDEDIKSFANISEDFNPIHFDENYAKGTIFGRRIAHGMISLSKFSGIFGMDMPGLGTLWVSQYVHFHKPVFIGEPYTAVAEIISIDRRRVTIATWVEDAQGTRVLSGEGTVIPISDKTKRSLSDTNSASFRLSNIG